MNDLVGSIIEEDRFEEDNFEDIYELTPMQEGMLFHTLYTPGTTVYNVQLGFTLEGDLDHALLQRAWCALLERHAVLRTSFIWEDLEKPFQVVHRQVELALAYHDYRGLSSKETERKEMLLIDEDRKQVFDLGVPPLMRFSLIQFSDKEYRLIWTFHHIILEGWSAAILSSELWKLYYAYSSGTNPELPPSRPYVDYIRWLQKQDRQQAEGYWRGTLKNFRSPTPLPLQRSGAHSPAKVVKVELEGLSLSKKLSDNLNIFARNHRLTLNTLIQAAWTILLSRYSGESDIVFGAVVSGRPPGLEGSGSMVGMFVNTLPARVKIKDDSSLVEWLKELQKSQIEMRQYEYTSLLEVRHWSEVEGSQPLFENLLGFENWFGDFTESGEENGDSNERLKVQIASWNHGSDQPIALFALPGRILQLLLMYDIGSFKSSDIRRVMGHIQALLLEIVKSPGKRISDLSLLTNDEQQQIVIDWNQTSTGYPRDKAVPALFEEQVALSPDATAVEYEGVALTYAQLNERANQLAHYLQARGVGPEVRVGVFLERGLEMVVALLGILKAGGAYVPVDLDYPSSRIAFMLEDAHVPVLLTASNLTGRLPDLAGERVCLDTDWAKIEQESADNPEVTVSAENLAYVIYTSGSTGIPKGVEIPHCAINRLVRNTDYYQVDATDRIAQASNVSFDAATFEIWGALLNGAQLIGIDKEVLLNSKWLAAFLEERRITAMFITTAVFNQIARELPGAFSGLKGLMFGGEAVDCDAVRRVLENEPPERLLHVYGPTESTTFASWYLVESVPQDAVTVPIGRPLANTTLYVLDQRMNPVPVGVPGELYIGGDGLARGYLNQPELTAERFVSNPFDSESTLYRTGDKVRYRDDGAIEFMGRFDDQIKLRGFRVELGEIETALINHDAVQDAVAIVREDEPGDKRIAAYLVPATEWVEQITSSQSGDHVDEWQALYEETYRDIDADQDLTTNFTGWNSSYTGEPIPLAEMEEWQAATVARVAALQPRRVLEIGCGTGLLLYRLAPDCERYVGADFSAVAQAQVQSVVSASKDYQNVELWQRMADDFSGVEAGDFDTVIINSVTQYLPSMDYLAEVIEGAVTAIADGGRIMLGDIRSLPLLKAYHTSVQVYLSPDEAGGSELLRNIQQHVEEENELVIEPAFFHALQQRIARLSHVEILLKQGQYHNELTGYRYDVVLHVEATAEGLPENGQWLDWGASGLDEDQLQERLKETDQEWLGINSIPNARIARDVRVLEQLQGDGGSLSVGELRQGAESGLQAPVEPATLWQLADQAGYQLELSYSGAGTDGRMDALFRRSRREDCAGHVFWPQQQVVPERPWSAYGTNPLKGRLGHELIPLLRQDLQQDLPEYMLPSVYVMLDSLPLNPNGKVDRKALPVPGNVRASLGAEYTAPRTELEQQLAQIWSEVLKLERVGIHDNFFDLGGHSLMATQVVSRIRAQLNVDLPLSEMFGYPTVAELAPVVESLQDEHEGDEADIIPVADRDGHLPLSFAQERFWFLNQLEPESPAYNVPMAIKLKGDLDVAALMNSLNALVSRHEGLRTHFSTHQGKPAQVIEEVSINLVQDDLSVLSSEAQEREVKTLVNEEALRPFDLSTGPLLRCRLLHLSGHEHVLLLTMHHIITDGWSLGVLFRELGACYTAFSAGQQPVLPAMPIQYADFAVWQHEFLSGEVLESQLTYWQQKLADLETLNLPTDRPRPAIQTHAGASEILRLDAGLSEQLEVLSKQAGVTLFMTMLGAFAVLMQRYSGQDDVVVGTPIANRNRAELEGLIGFFINSLVMRTDVSGNPGFRELLFQVQETALEAYQHQDIPFEKLVEILQPRRDRGRNPLFQVQFLMQNAPMEPLELQGLTLEAVSGEWHSTIFDLECHIWSGGAEFDVIFVYNTDLFDAATIRRMLEHYRHLLQSVVADPDRRVSELAILGAEESRLLDQWNPAPTDYPHTQTVPGLFEQQVSANPDAIAVEYQGSTLSFARLNEQANQLAHYLQAQGVGPGAIVGICVERSLEMVVGLLSILKTGGAYLPLDPEYPVERLNYMLDDSGAAVLLSRGTLPAGLVTADTKVVCFDRDAQAIATQSDENLNATAAADDLAYVIYTSGSTGKPKGVMGLHRGIVNRLCWMWDAYPYVAGERCCQKTTLNFVDSVAEIFSPLLAGLSLVVVDEAVTKDARALARLVSEERVTRMWVVPSLLRALLELGEEALSGLECARLWVAGGERLEPELEAAFHARFPGAVLLNVYGSSEVSADVTYFDTAERGERGGSLIGRPIANTRAYVLDDSMNRVPVGVPGELHIGGAGLARGYLGRAELTAQRFVADPFAVEAGALLFKTGDLARYCADGVLEYLGRIDHQVKLRGFRIELGEIESLLCQHEALREAVVLCRDEEALGQRLVAYVVADGPEELQVADLRSFVRQQLPEYMVPSAFMVLDSFPLTANGKLDREALPLPEFEHIAGENYVAPHNDVEIRVAKIWRDLLGIEKSGIRDNFFDLGGHSLLMGQVQARLLEEFDRNIPMLDLFQYPTIESLASHLVGKGEQAKRPVQAHASMDKRHRLKSDRYLPASYGQERLLFLEQLLPDTDSYNVPLIVKIKGPLKIEALEKSLNEIISRHESLRTRFTTRRGKYTQIIESEQPLKIDVVSMLDNDEVMRQVEKEKSLPFDLATGPLLRCKIFKFARHDHILVLTLHYIVCDAWSFGLFFKELRTFYDFFSEGKSVSLPDLPIQYADYAARQRAALTGQLLEELLGYWRDRLKGLATLQLPTDHPRPPVQSFQGGFVVKELPLALSSQLRTISEVEEVTPFMTLLAAFTVLLHRYCGQDDIVVGTPIANRSRSETEDLIGFFVNMLVLRTDLSGSPSFRELLARVKNIALGAYKHQDLPFEKLVSEFRLERDISRNPLFQVTFALQNAPLSPIQLKGLTIEPVQTKAGATRFDLEINLWESDRGLIVSCSYNEDLFEASTIQRMLAHYQQLLGSVIENPDQSIDEMQLLLDDERHLLLRELNSTATDLPPAGKVQELIENQAKKSPQANAVVYAGKTLSYDELNQRANRLAHYLIAAGISSGSYVAVLMERTPDLVVAQLAALKAGAAYVAIDPDYPTQRLEFILADTQSPVLLTQSSLGDRVTDYQGRILSLDADGDTWENQSTQTPDIEVDSKDVAYVIYISGSTGEPKGVEITHGGLSNLVSWHCRSYQVTPEDRATHLAGLGFDASVWELWPYLCAGASIHLVPDEQRLSPAGLWSWMEAKGITLSFMPTPLAEAALQESLPTELKLRVLLTGGDRLHGGLISKELPFRVVNHYGPTENTVVSTCAEIDLMSGGEPPIGTPIDNVQTYILDRYQQPVPVGVPGELYIGGDGLARGYLNQPELTAERFVHSPFAENGDARLYRTGDMVRYQADGSIEFIGRVDNQVKIRGFRIELGEIESVLCRHPGVGIAAAAIHEDEQNTRRILAYVVLDTDSNTSADELRGVLEMELPTYMVPTAIIRLDELPMTANDKVDRKALPVPGEVRTSPGAEYTAPRNDLERQLAGIWSEELELERVGVHDNFFDLGGHSLMVTRVVSRIREYLNLDLSVAILFDYSTVAALAEYIETIRWVNESHDGGNRDLGEHREVGEL